MEGGKDHILLGGIEGGATHTQMVLLDSYGKVVAEADIPESTNHWQIGLDECLKRLNKLILMAKNTAGIDERVKLSSLGLSLSGADSVEASLRIHDGLMSEYPDLSESISVYCDTVGTIVTACPNGGMALIAGTGSNCQLINPDGEKFRCGGWGHVIGDEGGAYWISHFCLKVLFDSMDNLVPTEFDTTHVHRIMCEYFDVHDQMGMLTHFYTEFQKEKIAGMCSKIAACARDERDALCRHAFYNAGRLLAWHILALLPKTDKSLISADGGLQVVCTGSVWKSWDLLRDGFVEGLRSRSEKEAKLQEMTLLQLTKPATYGSAYIGAQKAGLHFTVPVNYAENATKFFHYKANDS